MYVIVIRYPMIPVLIDTWWNVNKEPGCLGSTSSNVLIDTWWNVNSEDCIHMPDIDRF